MRCIKLNKLNEVRLKINAKIYHAKYDNFPPSVEDQLQIDNFTFILQQISTINFFSEENAIAYPELPYGYVPLQEDNERMVSLLTGLESLFQINVIEEYDYPVAVGSTGIISFIAPLAATLMGFFINNAIVHPRDDLDGC